MSARMDDITLYMNCITLMFLENSLGMKLDTSQRKILEHVKGLNIRQNAGNFDDLTSVISQLRETVLDLAKHDNSERLMVADLKMRLGTILRLHPDKLSALESNFKLADTPDEARRVIPSYRKFIFTHINEEELIKTTRQYFNDFQYRRDQIEDVNEHFGKMLTVVQEFIDRSSGMDSSKVVAAVNFSDTSSLLGLLQQVKEEANDTTMYRLGWKCVNRMLGGGLHGSRQVLVGALEHNYKTGFTLDVFRHIAMYNAPVPSPNGKKPTLLRISLEDELVDNIKLLYSSVIRNTERRVVTKADLLNTPIDEMAKTCVDAMQATGWTVLMERLDPTNMTYQDLQQRIIQLDEQGYDVRVLCVDYLAQIPTTGCTQGPAGVDIRDLFRKTRNFCSPRGILMITPHQLSTDATNIRRLGTAGFLKTILGGKYYSGSKQITQEVDVEICLSKEEVGGETFLEIGKGKHRGGEIVPHRDKICCMKFQGELGLLDDVHLEDDFAYDRPGGVQLKAADGAAPILNEYDDMFADSVPLPTPRPREEVVQHQQQIVKDTPGAVNAQDLMVKTPVAPPVVVAESTPPVETPVAPTPEFIPMFDSTEESDELALI